MRKAMYALLSITSCSIALISPSSAAPTLLVGPLVDKADEARNAEAATPVYYRGYGYRGVPRYRHARPHYGYYAPPVRYYGRPANRYYAQPVNRYYAPPVNRYYAQPAYQYYAQPTYQYYAPPVVYYPPPIYIYPAPPVVYSYTPAPYAQPYYGAAYRSEEYAGW